MILKIFVFHFWVIFNYFPYIFQALKRVFRKCPNVPGVFLQVESILFRSQKQNMKFLECFFVGQNPIKRSARFTALTEEKKCDRNMQILEELFAGLTDSGICSRSLHGCISTQSDKCRKFRAPPDVSLSPSASRFRPSQSFIRKLCPVNRANLPIEF